MQDEKASFTKFRNFKAETGHVSINIFNFVEYWIQFFDSFSNFIQPFSVANLKNYIFSVNLL